MCNVQNYAYSSILLYCTEIPHVLMFSVVLGEISPSEMGRTLTHEHMSMSFEVSYVPPPRKELSKLPWTFGNAGYIRQNP